MGSKTRLGIALGFLLAGCGSTPSGTPPVKDAGIPDRSVADVAMHDAPIPDASEAAAGYPAPHPAMPQVVDLGGPVMTSPKFVVITFAGDTLAPQIDAFVDAVAASKTYWSGTTAEYKVGPIAEVLHVSLDESPSGTLADSVVQTWITGKLSGPDAGTLEGGAPWPQPDGETVYMIYYPASVSVTLEGGTSCSSFYGYHNDYLLTGSTYVTYSVVARCPPFPMTSAIDSITAIASHEMVEAVTDPRVADDPAWYQPDNDHIGWAIPAGGELGDMCAGFGNVFYTPSDVPFLVQRTWSNASAAASHDPCQPDGAMPYFNSAAVLTQGVTFDEGGGQNVMTKGISIPVGGTGTVTLDLYSDAKSGPWTVQALDFASLFTGGPPDLALSFGGKSMVTGSNGDTVSLSIKVLSQGQGGVELFWIQNTIGETQTVWLGLVGSE